MKVGDLVRNMHTGEVYIITNTKAKFAFPKNRDADACDAGLDDYVEVDSQWLVPEEHLELISESR